MPHNALRGGLLVLAIATGRQRPRHPCWTFVGVIGDSECPRGDHSTMKMGGQTPSAPRRVWNRTARRCCWWKAIRNMS